MSPATISQRHILPVPWSGRQLWASKNQNQSISSLITTNSWSSVAGSRLPQYHSALPSSTRTCCWGEDSMLGWIWRAIQYLLLVSNECIVIILIIISTTYYSSASCSLIAASDNFHKLTTQLTHVHVGYLLALVNAKDMMLVMRSLLVLRNEDNGK